MGLKFLSIPFFLFLFSFFVFLHHLSPSVYGGDVGDFLSAIAVKGVAHPSGYPLFTMLGIAFSFLPLPYTLAWKVGLISVFFSSLSVMILYFLILEFSKQKILAIISALTLGFVYPFWFYAELAEIFALSYFFEILLLLLAVLYYKRKKIYFLYILSFFCGLSLTNNETIVLIFPSLAILALAANWRIILKPKLIVLCILFFFLGLLPYLYIPIAAYHNPPINWDNAKTWQNFVHLVLRKDYGWTPWYDNKDLISAPMWTMYTYVSYWVLELPPLLLFSSLFGAVYLLLKRNWIVVSSIILGFFLTGPFFVSYWGLPPTLRFTIGVQERFYMFSGIFMLLLMPFGIIFLIEALLKLLARLSPIFAKRKYYKDLFYFFFFIIPIFLFSNNFERTDLHNVWLGDYFAEDLLTSLPKNSTVYVFGDTVNFNTLYVHYGRGIRKDISIHAGQLYDLGPEAFKKIYISTVQKSKNELKYIVYLQAAETYAKTNNFFSTKAAQYPNSKYGGKILWMPYGLVFKLANDVDKQMSKDQYLKLQNKIWNNFHLEDMKKASQLKRNLTIAEMPSFYANAASNIGDFLYFYFKDLENAKTYYKKAIEIDPESEIGYKSLGLYYLHKNNCQQASNNFKRMTEVNGYSKEGYLLLYKVYKTCFKDIKRAKKIEAVYTNIFHESFANALEREDKSQ